VVSAGWTPVADHEVLAREQHTETLEDDAAHEHSIIRPRRNKQIVSHTKRIDCPSGQPAPPPDKRGPDDAARAT